MWRDEPVVARPDERVANKPFRIKGGKPDSGCLFCLSPSGDMHEYHMHMSDYSYFTCSKEECKSKGYNIAREVNKKIISFASDYLLKNIWKKEENIWEDEEDLWITLEGREYLLSTTSSDTKGLTDTMRKYDIQFPQEEKLKSDIQTSMVSILNVRSSQLVDDMWKHIFITANEMVDDDIRELMKPLEHVCIQIEPHYHYMATEVTVDDFKIKIDVTEGPERYCQGTPYGVTFLDNGELHFYEYGRHR